MPDRRAKKKSGKNVFTTPPNKTKRGIEASQFKKQFDIPLRIKDGISEHLKGIVMLETDFRQLLGIPADKFRRTADTEEFNDHRVKANGKWYWGQKKTINEIKETMDLY